MLYAPISPIYFRLLFQTGSLDAQSAERLMDVALEGLGAKTGQRVESREDPAPAGSTRRNTKSRRAS